jgi:GT2 family glycosyltransferase
MKPNIDVIIISDAKTESLKALTLQTLQTLFNSDADVNFYAYVIESSNSNFSDIHPHIKMVYPKVPFGYHKYLNIGRKLGISEYVCLCNNDLIFRQKWATNIISEMKANGLISASPLSIDHNTARFSIKENSGNHLGYTIGLHVAGWCIFQDRKIYDIIGDLDERFIFWYCDDDYAQVLKLNKIPHALVTSSRVDHAISKTLFTKSKPEINLLTSQQERIFKAKWKK